MGSHLVIWGSVYTIHVGRAVAISQLIVSHLDTYLEANKAEVCRRATEDLYG